jgi:hypothetical protein
MKIEPPETILVGRYKKYRFDHSKPHREVAVMDVGPIAAFVDPVFIRSKEAVVRRRCKKDVTVCGKRVDAGVARNECRDGSHVSTVGDAGRLQIFPSVSIA